MQYDLIVIGMGISGISAAIYAKNSGLNVLMLEKDIPGGLTNKINVINNYPGFSSVSGPDLAFQLYDSIKKADIPFKKREVKNIKLKEDLKIIETDEEEFVCKNIILAIGRKNRLLGLEHEEELLGHGISTCALCDGNLYKGKDIAIVGGGNSAIEEAIYLSKIVNKIYLIHRRDIFSAEKKLIDELNKCKNIEFVLNSNVTKLLEENNELKGIIINDTREINISGLFIYIGFTSNTSFLDNLDITDEEGYIKVDEHRKTCIPGIYAVGDCIKKDIYQLITASSDGVTAAINIIKNN